MTYHDACPACRLENPVSREARLSAAMLAKKRFEGRAALEEKAKWGNHPEGDIALAKLRKAIGFPSADQELREAEEAFAESRVRGRVNADYGLPSDEAERLLAMSPRERVVWCQRHAGDASCYTIPTRSSWLPVGDAGAAQRLARREIAWDLAPEEMRKRRDLSANRTYKATQNQDKLAARKSGYAVDATTRTVFLKTLKDAGFREATHSHENKITLSDRGHEGVESRTSSMSASDAGLGRSYQKYARFVTASEHVWFVSSEIMTPAVKKLNASAPKGILYLRTDLRAKQGAGTSIKTQKKTPRGAWT
jgi:hypothetical protein